MKSSLEKIKKENSQKIIYSRILTNKMTIIAWKLFKGDRHIHYAFLIYRLRRDFGFTRWEIANFTGIPMQQIDTYIKRVKPILDSEILHILSRMDEKKELDAWRDVKRNNNARQGYRTVVRDYPAWYDEESSTKKYGKPKVTFGDESEKEWEEKIKNGK